ncbi:MAG: ankyrin repeat domain-containing protein [Verrucomicrobiota bacterium]
MPFPRPQAFLTALAIAAIPVAGTGCRDRQEKARAGLQAASFSFTVGDFLKAAGEGRLTAVTFFLDAGMNPDVTLADGRTALLAAASRGQGETVKLLLARGAKATSAGTGGLTPLLAAVHGGDERAVSALLQAGADPTQRGLNGETPLTAAALLGHAALAGILAPISGEPPGPALRLASGKGHTAVMDVLLNAGAGINFPGDQQRTPLMLAAMAGHLPAVKLLCHRQARLSPRDAGQQTAAGLAKAAGHLTTASWLEEWAARHPDETPGEPGETALASAGPLPPPPSASASPAPAGDAAGPAPSGTSTTSDAAASAAASKTLPPPSAPVPEAATAVAAFNHADAGPPPETRSITSARFPRLACDGVDDVPGLLRMISYQLRPWPFLLWDVDRGNESADVELTLEGNRKVNVRVGSTIPGTDCVIEKARRRRVYDDTKPGKRANTSDLTFRCARTSEVFRASPGIPVLSSDSSAFLRISGSATVWSAAAGDEFRLGTTLLKITAIEPQVIVMENRLTRESVRVSLTAPVKTGVPPAKADTAPGASGK